MTAGRGLSATVTRNFIALGAGESVARIVAFLATVYIARSLGAASYGVISFAAAIMLYLGRLADGGIEQGLGVRELAASAPDRQDDLIASLTTARFLLALVFGGILVLGAQVLAPEPERSILTVMAVVLVFQGLSVKWVHLGFESTGIVAAARLAGELVMLAVAVVLVRDAGDVAAVPLAQAVGDAVLIMILVTVLRRRGRSVRVRVDPATVAPLIRRATPLMISALLGLIIYNSDLLFLRFFHDARAVGYYAAAYGLISFFINIGGAYQQSLLPTLTRAGGVPAEQRALFGTATAHVFTVTLPATVGIALYAPEIINTAFGMAFQPSGPALAWLSLSVLLLLNRSVPHVALLAAGRENLVLRINLVATVINLVLNVLLIPRYAILGAAWSTVATEVARLGLAWAFASASGFGPAALLRGWRALLATGAMAATVLYVFPGALWTGAPVGALVFVLVMAILGGVRLEGAVPRLNV